MEHVITIGCLLIVSLLSGIAVFHADYHDSLSERIGLSFLSIGALGMAKYVYSVEDVPGAVLLCSIGGAVFALEVGRKVLSEKAHSPDSDSRRSRTAD